MIQVERERVDTCRINSGERYDRIYIIDDDHDITRARGRATNTL